MTSRPSVPTTAKLNARPGQVRQLRGLSTADREAIGAWLDEANTNWYLALAGAPGLPAPPLKWTILDHSQFSSNDASTLTGWHSSPLPGIDWQYCHHQQSLSEEAWLNLLATHLCGMGENDQARQSSLSHGQIAGNLASKVWALWFQQLQKHLPSIDHVENKQTEKMDTWSGHAFAKLAWHLSPLDPNRPKSTNTSDLGELYLKIDPAIIDTLRDPSSTRPKPLNTQPLRSLKSVMATHATRLSVHLSPVELSMADILALQIGDVIAIEHPLNQALSLKIDQSSRIGWGWLGQRQGRRALELTDVSKFSDLDPAPSTHSTVLKESAL